LGDLGIRQGFGAVLFQAGYFRLANGFKLGLEGLGLVLRQLPRLNIPMDLDVLLAKTNLQFLHWGFGGDGNARAESNALKHHQK
jgi:hypothetical protein